MVVVLIFKNETVDCNDKFVFVDKHETCGQYFLGCCQRYIYESINMGVANLHCAITLTAYCNIISDKFGAVGFYFGEYG